MNKQIVLLVIGAAVLFVLFGELLGDLTVHDYSINLGETWSHTFTLTNNENYVIPDTEYADGSRSWVWAGYQIYNKFGSVVDSGSFEVTDELNPGETIPYEITYTPSTAGKYSVAVVMVEKPMIYTNGEWVEQDTIKVDEHYATVTASIPQPPTPVNPIIAFFQSIIDYIKSLFGW